MKSGFTRKAQQAAVLVVLVVLAALTTTCAAGLPGQSPPPWASPGLVGSGGWPFAREAIPPADADGAYYLPDSSVLALPGDQAMLIPFGAERAVTVSQDDLRVASAVAADRAWLATGHIPGSTRRDRDMAARALLDLRMLTHPGGASTASWYGAWNYVWPRDAAFVAVAFAATGHAAEARQVLSYLARVQDESGLWAARYHPDGTAVTDGRGAQLDALGWVLWAGWFLHQRAPETTGRMITLWPMLRRAADRAADALRGNGLPTPSPDYWERDPGIEQDPHQPTLGVAGPLLTGLRAATALAYRRGSLAEAHRWHSAARRLARAIDRHFAPYGYPRSPVFGGALDTSVTFLAPPFGPPAPGVTAAVTAAGARLRLPGGGVLPGERWAGRRDQAWTPETALFALAAAASGDLLAADAWLGWLAAHRTSLGSLPEKVGPDGRQAGVAPLGWTSAIVLLALMAPDGPLPTPPAY